MTELRKCSDCGSTLTLDKFPVSKTSTKEGATTYRKYCRKCAYKRKSVSCVQKVDRARLQHAYSTMHPLQEMCWRWGKASTESKLRNALDEIECLKADIARPTDERDKLAQELLTPEVFMKLIEWLREPNRRRAVNAFTAGIERQIAYALESSVLSDDRPVTNLPS